jgi:hypothetical protein
MRLLPWTLAAALAVAGCDVQVGEKGFSLDIAHGKAVDEWVRTYTLPANGRVEIENVNGQIEVLPAPGRDVEVRAEREARFHSEEAAREALKKVEMGEEVTPGRVRIAARTSGGGFGDFGRVTVKYTVRVPAGLTVAMKTRNGGIRVEDVNGAIEASSTNGGITVDGLSGSLDVTVVNGGVRADLAEVKGDVRVTSTNGGIRLDLPTDVKADLSATWVNGGFDIDDAFRVSRVDSSARELTARLNGGGPRITINTVNGGVRVRPWSTKEAG